MQLVAGGWPVYPRPASAAEIGNRLYPSRGHRPFYDGKAICQLYAETGAQPAPTAAAPDWFRGRTRIFVAT